MTNISRTTLRFLPTFKNLLINYLQKSQNPRFLVWPYIPWRWFIDLTCFAFFGIWVPYAALGLHQPSSLRQHSLTCNYKSHLVKYAGNINCNEIKCTIKRRGYIAASSGEDDEIFNILGKTLLEVVGSVGDGDESFC